MNIRVILLTENADWGRNLATELRKIGPYSVVSIETQLLQAYSSVEIYKPNIVAVSHKYTSTPEFEMFVALCANKHIGWFTVMDPKTRDTQKAAPIGSRYSGIFSLSVADSPATFMHQIEALNHKSSKVTKAINPLPKRVASQASGKLVLLGSSTGGIDALSTVMETYPADCPPTLIVQHTGTSFGGKLVELLDRISPAKIERAIDGQAVKPGHVYVAVGQRAHMRLSSQNPQQIRLVASNSTSGHVPSVDALFESALPIAKRCVAGILTGMGKDGAAQLLELRRSGARTFAQDERSSVVYGMPKVAWENGGAEIRVPIGKVASCISDMCASTMRTN
ncbi:MAG: CheB methylesterase domain-containing protein [Litoreibacter sp.]